MTRPIYMDNHATTRVDPRVLETILPWFSEEYGNAASKSHAFGWNAEAAVERAREQLAGLVDGSPAEIVFTSGATEANNLALIGAARAGRAAGRGDHLVTLATEHKSVVDVGRQLEADGFRVTYLQPGGDGLIDAEAVAAAVDARTLLVSVMLVNNEIGVIQPVAGIASAVKTKNAATLIHCDAAQAAGRLPLSVARLGVDLLSISAHKIYGPKGVGALWVRRRPRARLEPILFGGGHERGLRSGTLPVPLIVGFGAAAALADAEREAETVRVAALRDRLHAGIRARLDGVTLNGSATARVAGNLNLSFAGVDGEALLMSMRDVAVSSGSACTSASLEPSYVLRALGVPDELAHASIRFGLGRFNTEAEVDRVIELVADAVTRLRAALGAAMESSHVG